MLHTPSRQICNNSFPWVMKMIFLWNQYWINYWPVFKTHEFIISQAVAYLCKDFTEYSLSMNFSIPKHIFSWPTKCLITIHVVWNLQCWVLRKINFPFRTYLWHFCIISNYHHIVVMCICFCQNPSSQNVAHVSF